MAQVCDCTCKGRGKVISQFRFSLNKTNEKLGCLAQLENVLVNLRCAVVLVLKISSLRVYLFGSLWQFFLLRFHPLVKPVGSGIKSTSSIGGSNSSWCHPDVKL